ncbi:MerR family transcriptional regulator [Pseudoduganella sp. FT25W]|uniref:MerR family transcriptional regulator n=1 Tax=Duganella alba TaxID=2666081 RepID=A0A6L5QP35_9BURK|nr:MerR family transcriptional regulator [Duganella alba]MRX11457.1 MerR family transcriptional regulator [Duganella alba]MRX19554.1 MerR family transcriptional regulator [Duganella alba]
MGPAILTAVVIDDDAALTLQELAQACAVEPDWVVARVRTGILLDDSADGDGDSAAWRFTSADLVRARRLCQIERAFDANDDVAALVVDLSEEIRRLRGKLSAAGVK